MRADGAPVSSRALFLDHEQCIAAFEKMHYLRSLQQQINSTNNTNGSGNGSPVVGRSARDTASAGAAAVLTTDGDSPTSLSDASSASSNASSSGDNSINMGMSNRDTGYRECVSALSQQASAQQQYSQYSQYKHK